MTRVNEILLWLSVWSVVLPAVAGAIVFRWLDIPSRFIWLMTVCAVIPQLIRYFTNNTWIRYLAYNLYILAEFSFTVGCFLVLLGWNKGIKKNFILLYALSYLLLYIYFATARGFGVFFSELVCLNNLFVVACILITCYIEVKIDGTSIISLSHPYFLFFIGWMLYAPITLIMFALWNFLKRNPDSVLQNLWIIHHLGNSIMYLLFTVGFVFQWKYGSHNRNFYHSLTDRKRWFAIHKQPPAI